MSDGRTSDPGAALGDYDALFHGFAACRIERDVVVVQGPDATTYLQGQASQDVAALAIGGSAQTLLLEPDGKVDVLCRITRTGEHAYVLDTDPGFGPVLSARLGRFKLRAKFEVSARSFDCVALRGADVPDPSALRRLGGWTLEQKDPGLPEGPLVLTVDDGAWRGADVLGPSPLALPAGARDVAPEVFEAARVEVGIPRMGAEITEKSIPAEAHLVDTAVSFTKGCYTGQELVARLDARGSKVARRLCGLVLADERPLGSLVGAELRSDEGKVVGSVTSAALSPVHGTVAQCYLHRSMAVPVTVMVEPTDGSDDVRARASDFPLF